MISEELLVDAAYEMAQKKYNIYRTQFKSLSIDKDDYIQDAVMYILDLNKKGYMHLDKNRDPRGMIFTMLGRFTKNMFQVVSRKRKKYSLSLDKKMPGSEDDRNYLDTIEDKSRAPDIEDDLSDKLAIGKSLLDEIVDKLSVVPYKTRKHEYIGRYPALSNRPIKLSEYNIAMLLLMGNGSDDILRIYDAYAKNIGASSRATIVYRRINEVIKKLADMINSYSEVDREYIKLYISHMIERED